ncbi:hypothetical protein AOLI_G00231080 [Acnodon oligacanthus]
MPWLQAAGWPDSSATPSLLQARCCMSSGSFHRGNRCELSNALCSTQPSPHLKTPVYLFPLSKRRAFACTLDFDQGQDLTDVEFL